MDFRQTGDKKWQSIVRSKGESEDVPDAIDILRDELEEAGEISPQSSNFYLFEPWDVGKRPDWVLEQAKEDGIDLGSEMFTKHIGPDPHDFQAGYLMSTAFFRTLIGGTSLGKSYPVLMEMIIMLTAEIPISLRYPKGFKTDIKRLRTSENIERFGRFDANTGTFIDHNINAHTPETENEWDCGNIEGVGVYPEEKISPSGSEFWIGTFMRAMNEYWWPRLEEKGRIVIPEHLIDRSKGNEGYDRKQNVVYLIRNSKCANITYDSRFNRFEAERVWACALDEEPDDPRIVQAAQQHAHFMMLVMTPYHGITYTKDLIFPKEINSEKKVFHATQYDSPYQNKKKIEVKRSNMQSWDIGARVWGVHTEVKGKPYFDRKKIMTWINKYSVPYTWARFIPQEEYYGIIENPHVIDKRYLMNTHVSMISQSEDDLRSTWRVYKEVVKGKPYLFVADPAEGAETPIEAGDPCAGIMFEAPASEFEKPVIVATISSTLETIEFARVCSHAMRVYNNATLGAETRRGAANATFAGELSDWPYWYHLVTIQDSTQKPKAHKGFDTNSATRSSLFDLIDAWIKEYSEGEYPDIPDLTLLKELAACVKGKNGRPDHTKQGTLDKAICLGIGLYIFKFSPEQVRFNGEQEEDVKPFQKLFDRLGITQEEESKNEYLGAVMPTWR